MASESGKGGLQGEGNPATIRIFGSHDSAELAAANLEAHGIKCWIKADDCGGMYPNLAAVGGGVRLLVRASDADAAITLLDTEISPSELNQIEIEAIAAAPPGIVSPNKLAMGQILSGVIVGIIFGVILCLFYQWASVLGTKTYYHYARDGRPDEAWIYRDGHLTEHLQDRNLDGDWDYWAYHEHGYVVRTEEDNNFDGKPDETWKYSQGDLLSMEKDTDFNGIPDEFCTYKYHIIQQMDIKPNGSKFTTTREIFQNGVLTEIWRGGDSNGNFKEVTRYDPFITPTSTYSPAEFQSLLHSSK